MKKLFLIAAAALTLVACENTDNLIDDPVEAHISATIGQEVVSRAIDDKWTPGDEIGITMGNVCSNRKHATASGDGTFTGTPIYFRNKTDKLTITAYYPFAGTEGQMPAVVTASTGSDRQTPDEQKKIDFLYAVKENVSGASPEVNLTFSHLMSKLTFIFKNGNDGTDVSKITSCEINGLVLSGTFDPTTGICKANTTAHPTALSFTPTVTKDKEIDPLILFPQTVGKVTMKIHDNEEQDFSCELNFGPNGLQAGNNYVFTITVKKTTLSVNSTITNWNTEEVSADAISDDSEE